MSVRIQSLFNLDGRVALVTGGAGNLGSAMAEGLAESGAHVIIASRNLDKCREEAERISNRTQVQCIALQYDASNLDVTCQMMHKAAAHWGHLDILVNNAYSGPGNEINKLTGYEFTEAFRVGLTSYFVAAREARLQMIKYGWGRIINVASMYGMVASYPDAYEGLPFNSSANYHAVKGALLQLTRHMAVYWAKDNIRVNALSPGAFPSREVQESSPEFAKRLTEKVPLGRLGTAEELKGAVVFLASNASSYMAGHNLVVDGGWTAW